MSTPEVAIRRVDLRGQTLTKAEYQALLPRAEMDIESALLAIEPILTAVKGGDESTLIELGSRFDGVTPASIRVPRQLLQDSLAALDPKVRLALEEAIRRIRKGHAEQVRTPTHTVVADGIGTGRYTLTIGHGKDTVVEAETHEWIPPKHIHINGTSMIVVGSRFGCIDRH